MEQGQNQGQGLAPHHRLHEVDGIAMVSSQKPHPVLHVHARVNITNVTYDIGISRYYQFVTTTECKSQLLPVFVVNGGWSSWSEYGACSATCGTANKTRSRSCTSPTPLHGGEDCEGIFSETAFCVQASCPGRQCQTKILDSINFIT